MAPGPSTGGDGRSLPRLARHAGPAMAVLWVGGTLAATLLFPGFNWTSNTLAEVGTAGQPSAPVFDASLVLGSALGLVFLWRLWSASTNHLQRAGLALLGALIALVGVVQLGVGNPWIELVALAFILLTLPALALQGSGDVFAGRERVGVWSIWLGVVHLLGWQVLSIILGYSAAVPTFLSMVLLSAWLGLQHRRLGSS